MKLKYLMLLALLVVLIPTAQAATELLWYQFENNGGNDANPAVNNLTCSGAGACYSAVAYLGSYAGGGTGPGGVWLRNTDPQLTTGVRNWTVAYWIRATSWQDYGEILGLGCDNNLFAELNHYQLAAPDDALWANIRGDSVTLTYTPFVSSTWFHVLVTYETLSASNTNVSMWVNGTYRFSGLLSHVLTMSNTKIVVGRVCDENNGQSIGVYLDDLRVFNTKLDGSVAAPLLYNGGVGTTTAYAALETPPAAPTINFTLINQSPADITTTNLFDRNLIIYYNITYPRFNGTAELLTTVTPITVFRTVNGSLYEFDRHEVLVSNSSNETYRFETDENAVYPGTFNLQDDYYELKEHSVTTLANSNSFSSFTLLNVSATTIANYLEIMANRTTGTGEVWYCNSSYTFSSSVTVSPHCTLIVNSPFLYNHTHGSNSSHIVVAFTILNNKVGTVKVTPTSHFLVRGNGPGNTLAYYVPTIARVGSSKTTTNGGSSWSNLTGTYDGHIHQYNASYTFFYAVCAYNTTGAYECSAYTPDNLDVTNQNPSSVTFQNPSVSVNITRNITINWSAATGFNEQNISYYSIGLYNIDESLNTSIKGNNGLSTNYSWSYYPLLIYPGIYRIGVTAVDTLNQSRISLTAPVQILTDAELNVTLINAYTKANLSGFYGYVYNNNTGYNVSYNTTGAVSSVDIIKGQQIINIFKDGYSVSNDNQQVLTASFFTQTVNMSVYSSNSVFVNIYNQDTGIRITGTNMSVTVSGNESETLYTTTTGELFIENLTDGDYSFKFQGGNYTLTTYPVVVADGSTQVLNAYLLSTVNTVTFTVTDYNSGAEIEGASFSMQRLLNGSYTVVSSKNTDISGQAEFLYSEGVRYKFVVQATGYNDKTFYLDPILSPTYTVRMQRTTVLDSDIDFTGVEITLAPSAYYQNVQNNLTIVFTSPEGVLVYYFLNVTGVAGNFSFLGNNSYGGAFAQTVNITGVTDPNTRFVIKYGYDTTIGSPKFYTREYEILNLYEGSYANNTFISNRDKTYGLGLFERVTIGSTISIITAGVFGMAAGTITGGAAGLLVMGYLTYIGFMPIWAVVISMLVGMFFIVKWGG